MRVMTGKCRHTSECQRQTATQVAGQSAGAQFQFQVKILVVYGSNITLTLGVLLLSWCSQGIAAPGGGVATLRYIQQEYCHSVLAR